MPLAEQIYLSLGGKEERAWNPGNHFVDSDRRMAKGFAWLLDNRE